ncbi:MAG: signal transduction histidine kinase [Oceanicoccus sp.]|jgi:signal transduction histidine kinase
MRRLFDRFRRSLPTRLLLVFMVVCFCVVMLLIATLARGFSSQWNGGIKPHINQYLSYVNEDIGNPPNISRAEELAKILPINIYIDGPEQRYSSTGLPLDIEELSFERSLSRRRDHKSHEKIESTTTGSLRFGELHDRTVMRNQLGDYTVYFEVLHANAEAHGSGIIWRAMFWLLGILAIGYWVIQRMLKPVQDIKRGVKLMGRGDLNYRVPVRSENDLGELAGSINQMAGDIEGMLDAKRQLLLAVSHELRSPLTRAKIAVDMLSESNNKSSIADDLTEMQNLISEILETERMNGPHASLNRTRVNLAILIRSVAKEFATSKFRGSELRFELDSPLPDLALDETRIRLLLRNLIGNAITHSRSTDLSPIISTHILDNTLQIAVQDFGDGIAKEHIAHLTEPFYRADLSRARTTGGFGLGLHLCKLIAEAHGGKLQISSVPGNGSTMVVELPLHGDNQVVNKN